MPNYCVGPTFDKILSYSSFFKDYLGFCKSIDDYGFRLDEDGLPLIEDCLSINAKGLNFGAFYQTVEALTVQRALYYNHLGFKDKFVAFWEVVNDKLGSNPFVIGIDPLNEPAFSSKDIITDLYNKIPGNYDRSLLGPLYEDIWDNIGSDSGIMWFEPPTHPDIFSKYMFGKEIFEKVFPVGWSTPPGGEIGSTNHVLNGHTYCCQLEGPYCATGEPTEEYADICQAWHEMRMG